MKTFFPIHPVQTFPKRIFLPEGGSFRKEALFEKSLSPELSKRVSFLGN